MVTTYASWWRCRWRGEVPTERLPEHAAPDQYGAVTAAWQRPGPAPVARPTGSAAPFTGDACTPPQLAVQRQPLAVADDAMAAWGYRGDPALKETATRVGELHNGRPSIPLYAERTGPGEQLLVVYASRLQPDRPEWKFVAVWVPNGRPGGPIVDGAIGWAPQLRPDTVISILVPTPWNSAPRPDSMYGSNFMTNTLVVLAPPGSTRVDYRGCRDGETFDLTGGDTIVRNVGTLDGPGVLAVRTADGAVGYSGPAADMPSSHDRPVVMLQPTDLIPVPAGTRAVYRGVLQGDPATTMGGPTTVVRDATVLVRCRGTMTAEVLLDHRRLGTVPCDDVPHAVADRIDVQGSVEVHATAPVPDDERPGVATQVLVVVPA